MDSVNLSCSMDNIVKFLAFYPENSTCDEKQELCRCHYILSDLIQDKYGDMHNNDIIMDLTKIIKHIKMKQDKGSKPYVLLNNCLIMLKLPEGDPFTKFLELKKQWEEETAILSSITEISMHPAYQQIIGMGQTVVPYILSELAKKPGHWFWALKSITGEDPVQEDQRGNLKKMTKLWLKWAKEKGYIV